MRRVPLALFAYNRPDHVRRALTALERCERLEECELFICCDGPKSDDQAEAVARTRDSIRRWARVNKADVIERETNLGLARSIVTGVTDLCREYGQVIVLEDDLVVSPDFVHFMLEGLERYEDEKDVYQISGHLISESRSVKSDAFFMPLTSTWGWSTWKRAWKIFDWKAPNASKNLADPTWRERFDLGNTNRFSQMLEAQLAGKCDSWGILWWYAVFNKGGEVLYPRCSLVWNGGFDNTGIHCGDDSGFRQASMKSVSQPRFRGALKFPKTVQTDVKAFNNVKKVIGGKKPSNYGRISGFLRKVIF